MRLSDYQMPASRNSSKPDSADAAWTEGEAPSLGDECADAIDKLLLERLNVI